MLFPRKAASGPGSRDEAVDVAVAPETDVEVADVLLEPTESERGIIGLEEAVGTRTSALPVLLPVLLAPVAELALLPVADKEGVLPGRITDGLCMGETALPMPKDTARCPSLEGVRPPLVAGAAPSPKDPLTSRGFSPSLSKRERRFDKSA